jgi:hypothetical protein
MSWIQRRVVRWKRLLATCFRTVSYLAYSSILKMEATYSSEISVDLQRTTRRYFAENGVFNYNISSLSAMLRFSQYLDCIASTLFGRKRPWPNLGAIPALTRRDWRNHESPQSGQPVFRRVFEPSTSRMRIKIISTVKMSLHFWDVNISYIKNTFGKERSPLKTKHVN